MHMQALVVTLFCALFSTYNAQSNFHGTWTTKLSKQQTVWATNSRVCSYNSQEGLLSWDVSNPMKTQRTTLTNAFGLPTIQNCQGSSNIQIASDGTTFYAYFSDCLYHVWTSTDCVKFTKMDNPLIYQSYSRSYGLYPGKAKLLFLTTAEYAFDLYYCPKMLNPGTPCMNASIPTTSTSFDPSGPNSRVHYSGISRGWYVWNETFIHFVDEATFKITEVGKSPVNASDSTNQVRGFHFYQSSAGMMTTNVYWYYTEFYNQSINTYQYDTHVATSTGMKLNWKNAKTFSNMAYMPVLVTAQGAIILSNVQKTYRQCPTCPLVVMSSDGGATWHSVSFSSHQWLAGPSSVAFSAPSTVTAVGYSITDRQVIVAGGSITSSNWSPIISISGPRSLYPILSLKNNSMLWGVEDVGACEAVIWTSTDGMNWHQAQTLNNQSIPWRHAREFPPNSGNVVALVHDCNTEPRASSNFGDIWFFPVSGAPGGPAHYKAPVPPFPAVFHALGNGLENEIVAIGFPYGNDDPPQQPTDGNIWYGFSEDGQNWHVRNISSTLPTTCKFSYPAGLNLASNGKTIMYNAEDTPVYCWTNSTGIPPEDSWFFGSQRLGTIRGDPTTGLYLAGADVGGPYFVSTRPGEWNRISANANHCYGRATDGYGPGFALMDGLVINGGSNCALCIWNNLHDPVPTELTGVSLPPICPQGAVNAQSTGILKNNNTITFVLSSIGTNGNGILVYNATMN